MKRDRKMVCKLISEMFETENDLGIYNTTETYDKLVEYIEAERIQAIGWMYTEACIIMDGRSDIRKIEVPSILSRAMNDLDLDLEK